MTEPEDKSVDLGEEENPIHPFEHLSFSTLFWGLGGCRYKFYNQRLADEKIYVPPSFAMQRGTKFHEILEIAINANNESTLTIDELYKANNEFEHPMDEGYVETIFDYVNDNNVRGKVEERFDWKYEGEIPMVSIVDLVEGDIENGEYCITDFKTMGRNNKTNPLYFLQLLTYHLTVQTHYKDTIKHIPEKLVSKLVKFVLKNHGEVVIKEEFFEFSHDELDFLKNEIAERIECLKKLIVDGVFLRDRNMFSCGNCPLFEECHPFHRFIE